MVSGFLDRAEKIFEQLVEEPDYKEAALQQLVTIYQQTREWEKAIYYANQLAKLGNKRSRMRANIAHFWCEIAMLDQADGNTNKAIQHFKKALAEDPKCVRASIALGRIYLESEDYKHTIKYLTGVLEQDKDFISDVLPTIAECYHHLGQEDELVEFLRACIDKKAGVSARHIDCYMKDEDKEAVLDAFARQEFKILSNVSILAEGWDCAATGCMILARPTRSLIRWIQMVGRVLRPYDGKDKAILLDHSGTIARLGFPTDPLPLELDDGKKKDADKKNDKPVTTKICPKCHHVQFGTRAR